MKRIYPCLASVSNFLDTPFNLQIYYLSTDRRVLLDRSDGTSKRCIGMWRDMPFPELGQTPKGSGKKITIVGVGQRSVASGLALQNVFKEHNIVYYDGEVASGGFDFIQQDRGSVLLRSGQKLNATKDVSKTRNSEVCIFGVEATREDMKEEKGVMQTIQIYEELIPRILPLSPTAKVIVLSDPVNLFSYCAWKFSGLPAQQIMGSGTLLETFFFKKFLQWKTQVDSVYINAWVIGGNDISAIPAWTSVSASGLQLLDMKPAITTPKFDTENWREASKLLMQINNELRRRTPMALKLYGEEVARLTAAILWNTGTIFPVSAFAVGMYGVEDNVFLSLPCAVDRHGVVSRVRQALSPQEEKKLKYAMARMVILRKLFQV